MPAGLERVQAVSSPPPAQSLTLCRSDPCRLAWSGSRLVPSPPPRSPSPSAAVIRAGWPGAGPGCPLPSPAQFLILCRSDPCRLAWSGSRLSPPPPPRRSPSPSAAVTRVGWAWSGSQAVPSPPPRSSSSSAAVTRVGWPGAGPDCPLPSPRAVPHPLPQ